MPFCLIPPQKNLLASHRAEKAADRAAWLGRIEEHVRETSGLAARVGQVARAAVQEEAAVVRRELAAEAEQRVTELGRRLHALSSELEDLRAQQNAKLLHVYDLVTTGIRDPAGAAADYYAERHVHRAMQ